jgi:regulatory protein spx
MAGIRVYGSPRCISTRRTWELLDKMGKQFEKIDLFTEALPKWVLQKAVAADDVTASFNTRNPAWKHLRNKRFSKAQAVAFLLEHPEMIRRPLVVRNREVYQGYDEEELRKFLR